MRKLEIKTRRKLSLEQLEKIIRQCYWHQGLDCTMKTTLNKFPGSVHWHFKKDKEKGTLELTYYPVENRMWFSVQSLRKGGWMNEIIPSFKTLLEKKL